MHGLLVVTNAVKIGWPVKRFFFKDAARNPANFRAKEKRLLATLKELDAKLERLHKDRDAALKK